MVCDNTQQCSYIAYSCFGRLGSLNESRLPGFWTRKKTNKQANESNGHEEKCVEPFP